MSKHTSLVKQVPSYQSIDGNLHPNKLNALLANQRIEIRGLIQSQKKDNGAGTLTVNDAVLIVLDNAEEMAKVVRKYRRAIKKERETGLKAVDKVVNFS